MPMRYFERLCGTDKQSEKNMSESPASESENVCKFCHADGNIFFDSVKDTLYKVPGQWELMRCSNRKCGLVWIRPMPTPDEIPGFYKNYYTHNRDAGELPPEQDVGLKDLFVPWKRSALGMMFGYPDLVAKSGWTAMIARFVGVNPGRKERLGHRIMWLNGTWGNRVLDYGCGNGKLLRIANQLGWKSVGFEPDKSAAQVGRDAYGLTIYDQSINEIIQAEEKFNVITMSHVIEHLHDPVGTLKECAALLEAGGRIVIATPNFDSLGRKIFKTSWRGLEPPRHLNIFTVESLTSNLRLSGFEVEHIWASAYSAKSMYRRSRVIQKRGLLSREETKNPPGYARRWSKLFAWIESLGGIYQPLGEEIIAIARKIEKT